MIEGNGVGASLSGRRRVREGGRATERGGRGVAGPRDRTLRSEAQVSDRNLPAAAAEDGRRGMEGSVLGAKLGRSAKIDKRRRPAPLPYPRDVFEVGTASETEDTQKLAVQGRRRCVSVAILAARDLPAALLTLTDHEAEPRNRGTGNEALSEARGGI